MSFVHLALNKDTGQQVAIKFLVVDDELSGPAIMAELLAQRRCRQHPHIVQLQVCLLSVLETDIPFGLNVHAILYELLAASLKLCSKLMSSL